MAISASIAQQQRCVMTFSACPETFKNDTIVVPDKVVGIAPTVLACKDTAYIESTSTAAANSFFFIIDNSGSMSGNNGSDPTGARFTVTQALLDTIYKKQPNAQVGVSVFREVLYFDTSTTSRFWYSRYFKTMSTVYDTLPQQAYMPLLTLNQMYNGVRGIDILDSLLATTGSGGNANLRYSPNFSTAGNTNINIGFLAAREAFAATTTAKNHQYIIFLSDGDANRGQRDPGVDSIYYFRDSTRNVPTTFTVFFTGSSAGNVPANLQTMTRNIAANQYSTSNPNSAAYSIQASYNALLNVLLNNVISQINVPAIPVEMVLNNVVSNAYANGSFVFPDSFMIGTNVTQYSMRITYRYTNPITNTMRDTTDTTIFYVRHASNAPVPPGINFNCSTYINAIPVTATFLDTNHDGHLDRIDITWSDTDAIRRNMPSVVQWIQTLNLTLLDGTKVNLQAATIVPDLSNKTIRIILNQNSGTELETGWKTATFTLTDTAMSISGRPFTVVTIIDGAAPVIKSVCFVPAASADTLRVIFSEPVTPTNKPGSANRYFAIVNANGASISDTANPVLNQSDRLIYVYGKGTLTDLQSVKEGSRPLFPLELCGDVSIVTSYHVASNPFTPGKTTIPASQQDPSHPVSTGTRIEVSLLPSIQKDLQDGNVTGTVTVFDAVGNMIYSNGAMSIDKDRVKLFLTWDGKTTKGVIAGGGTYLAKIVIHDQVRGKTETLRVSVGLRQAK